MPRKTRKRRQISPKQNKVNFKDKKKITKRLMELNIKVDKYIYKNQPIFRSEAVSYSREIELFKEDCYGDERSLQVIEKLNLIMQKIIKEHASERIEENESGSYGITYTLQDSAYGVPSPVYSLSDDDNEKETLISHENLQNGQEFVKTHTVQNFDNSLNNCIQKISLKDKHTAISANNDKNIDTVEEDIICINNLSINEQDGDNPLNNNLIYSQSILQNIDHSGFNSQKHIEKAQCAQDVTDIDREIKSLFKLTAKSNHKRPSTKEIKSSENSKCNIYSVPTNENSPLNKSHIQNVSINYAPKDLGSFERNTQTIDKKLVTSETKERNSIKPKYSNDTVITNRGLGPINKSHVQNISTNYAHKDLESLERNTQTTDKKFVTSETKERNSIKPKYSNDTVITNRGLGPINKSHVQNISTNYARKDLESLERNTQTTDKKLVTSETKERNSIKPKYSNDTVISYRQAKRRRRGTGQDLIWVENLKFVREISVDEYDTSLSYDNESFWNNNELPSGWDDKDFDD